MGVGVAVGVELRPLWIRERSLWSRAKLLLSFGGGGRVKGIRSVHERLGCWRRGNLATDRREQSSLYRDLSWNSVVLSCTVVSLNRAAQGTQGRSLGT
jgi:hypothetical protein